MFDERKAAQVAAFFLYKAGGRMSVLKLMKLMYLAERKSYEVFGEPMIGDYLVSMDQGPVLSQTLNHMNGSKPSSPEGWETWVQDRDDYDISLRRAVKTPEADLTRLSDAELDVLDQVWGRFGAMNKWALVDWTHAHCPEWTDPKGSSTPIPYSELLEKIGYSAEQVNELNSRIDEHRAIRSMLQKAASAAKA